MEHKVNLDEISDGRLYVLNDSVPLACDGCRFLSETAKCCRFAEDTITLDAYDIWQLSCAGYEFAALFSAGILALSPVDSVLLPHLNFEKNSSCPFLDDTGRCKIHAHRPGLCRLFPLARGFREDDMFYVKQIHECPVQKETPVTVSDWLGIPDASAYERFCISWHNLLQTQRTRLANVREQEALTALSTQFLRLFFFLPYSPSSSFEEQYEARIQAFQGN